jgi:hypothetical protein
MEKIVVSIEYLLSWMNSEIAYYEACIDCQFTFIILTEPDEIGANWSEAELRCSGPGGAGCGSIEACRPIAQQVIDEAKQKFIFG